MRKDVRQRQDAHTRANGVCTEHRAIFDVTPGGQKMREGLDTRVAAVDRLQAAQKQYVQERRAAMAQIRASRPALRTAAKAVVTVGKQVRVPGAFMDTLEMPAMASDDELLAYSRGLLAYVSPYADAFVAEGLPPNLLKNLDEGIQAFAAAREAEAAARQRYAAAAASIQESLSEAAKAIKVLEVIAIDTPAAHPEVLTKLRMAKKIVRRKRQPQPQPQPQPAPDPAPTPPSTPTDKAA